MFGGGLQASSHNTKERKGLIDQLEKSYYYLDQMNKEQFNSLRLEVLKGGE